MSRLEIITSDNPILDSPAPNKLAAFFPSVESQADLAEQFKRKWGKTVVMVFGYGSFFNQEAGVDSLMDTMVISTNPLEFHRQNLAQSRSDYGTFKDAKFHTALNHFDPNYYPTEFQIDGLTQRSKYVVIGFDEFLRYARGGNRQALWLGSGMGFLTVAGRLQKAMLVPILRGSDSSRATQVDQAINQARIDGVWLALGLLPEQFHYTDLVETYARLSYMADRRIEKKSKAESLVARNPLEYCQMFEGLLSAFLEEGIVEEAGLGEFVKNYSLSERDVASFLSESANFAAVLNYLKNPWTYGPSRGLKYCMDKFKRATRFNHSDSIR